MAGRLLEEMHAVMRRRHYSIHTERSYSDWVKRYVSYHKMRSRDVLRRRKENRGIPHPSDPVEGDAVSEYIFSPEETGNASG